METRKPPRRPALCNEMWTVQVLSGGRGEGTDESGADRRRLVPSIAPFLGRGDGRPRPALRPPVGFHPRTITVSVGLNEIGFHWFSVHLAIDDADTERARPLVGTRLTLRTQ